MEYFYNDVVNYVNSITCILTSILAYISIPELDSSSFTNIQFVFSWLAFFHNTNIFPAVFISGFDAFLAMRIAMAFLSFLRWVTEQFSNSKVW